VIGHARAVVAPGGVRSVYSADHDAFRESVRAFVDRELLPRLEAFRAQHHIDRSAWLTAGRQGLLGLAAPGRFGGGGSSDYRFNAVLGEELARASMALNSCFQMHYDVALPYLLDLGTQEQQQRWLPGAISGEIRLTMAMTEPSGGSDLAALRTTAIRDGSHFVLNGSKTFITNGSSAELVIVAARTSTTGRKGISLFAVEAGTVGFTRGAPLDKVGQPEADTAELCFADARVPVENLLGELDGGWLHMMQRLPQERISAAIGNTAHAAQALDQTLEYVRTRSAFGQTIGSFQHSKFLLAELVTKLEVTQAYVDACIAAHAAGRLTAADAAKAKWWSSQVQHDVLDACVQLHGGYGYMNDYPVARAWRDGRVTRIWGGTNEIMKEIIARDLGL